MPRDGRGDSGHNFEWDTCIGDYLRFLGASTKHEWIPAFQPNDLFSFARFLDQQRINFILADSRFARRFTNVNNFGVVSCPAERLRIRQMIVNDHIRFLDALLGAQCYQTGVARSGANQVNSSDATLARAHAGNTFSNCNAKGSPS